MDKENVVCVCIHIYIYVYTHTHTYIHTHTMEYHSALKKEGNSAICNNMNIPGGHYAKWNKPVTEKQTLCDSTYMGYLK